MIDKLILPVDIKENLHKLTKKELRYFLLMWSKYGVLYLKSKPGIAKSAIIKSICSKLDFQFIDVRLSMRDEIDVGLYPNLDTIIVDGVDIKCLDFVVPKWAIRANNKKTIIHFEELNRAQQGVRNAALQILLDRQIGEEFKFNDGVLMVASGNLGEGDGTVVEEFDSALNNRLIHVKHELTLDDWLEGFALDNVHKTIIDFLKIHPELLSKQTEDPAFPSPRSWTMLSEFIVKNFGIDSQPIDWLPVIKMVGHSFIGPVIVKWIQYLEDMMALTIGDVLNGDWNKVKVIIKKVDRSKKSELLHSLKELDINKLNDHNYGNLEKFLKVLSSEEMTSYILHLTDRVDIKSEGAKKMLQNLSKEIEEIYKYL